MDKEQDHLLLSKTKKTTVNKFSPQQLEPLHLTGLKDISCQHYIGGITNIQQDCGIISNFPELKKY